MVEFNYLRKDCKRLIQKCYNDYTRKIKTK